ncbi:flagellar assembly protein T N-terminal domain-containing protein [Colwellia sp. E2M01]|uniref:flagellar assembly protein T N-terminal domain-containing protein n=1 Tax=Colwellia sp. E2M01 TaxID=2841561 RepID=UPI001C09607D|nr:flagellar assembly protein T N-terminal domain-containing protein [Colwellia sp. E2M01]MBU2869998.1 flagella assembly protein FlgT [Colwellia sp. E2M01]
MRTLIKTLLLIIIVCSPAVNAQWYETQGYANSKGVSIEVARTQAVENALKKALLVSGASVSSVQQVVNGLLTQDQISIRASGSVNSIELVDEIHSGNLITVTIRADIFPQEKKCFAVDFKKSLLITRSHLVHREQANIGEIYNIDKSVMVKLGELLNQHSTFTKTSTIIDNKTDFARLNNSLASDKISLLTQSLSDSTNSQYVMFSEITNLSFDEQSTNGWMFWQQGIYPRDFGLNVYLYNGLNGQLVWQNSYSNSAPWTFLKRIKVDPSSNAFWQSEYGVMVTAIVSKVIKDIDENIMCEPSQGKILKVQGNQVTVDLGRDNGLKIGDEFSLLHRTHFNSNRSRAYTGFSVSPYKVKVIKLTRETATAVTPDGQIFGNIQIEDIAVRDEN